MYIINDINVIQSKYWKKSDCYLRPAIRFRLRHFWNQWASKFWGALTMPTAELKMLIKQKMRMKIIKIWIATKYHPTYTPSQKFGSIQAQNWDCFTPTVPTAQTKCNGRQFLEEFLNFCPSDRIFVYWTWKSNLCGVILCLDPEPFLGLLYLCSTFL